MAISPARAEPADADYPFADQKAWSVRFAFYDHGSAEAVPIGKAECLACTHVGATL